MESAAIQILKRPPSRSHPGQESIVHSTLFKADKFLCDHPTGSAQLDSSSYFSESHRPNLDLKANGYGCSRILRMRAGTRKEGARLCGS